MNALWSPPPNPAARGVAAYIGRLAAVARGALRIMSVVGILSVSVHAASLKVVTYNVENYVAASRMTEAGYRKDYPKPEVQKNALRNVLQRLDADVVVLQEMGNQSYLDELRRDLKHDGLDYPHAILLLGPDPDRHVAMLSKRAITSAIQHKDIDFPYFGGSEKVKRGLLEATVQTPAGELTFFGVHLKSRYTDRADDGQSTLRRQGEAVALRNLVMLRFPEPARGLFLILGDFNDDRSSKTLQRFLRRGKVRIAELLAVADTRGDRWTHAYRKQDNYTRVDHILVSAQLLPFVRNGVGQIDDGDGVSDASDHRPVVVVLDFPDKK